MIDHVEWLRWCAAQFEGGEDWIEISKVTVPEFRGAADELERLRAERHDLKRAIQYLCDEEGHLVDVSSDVLELLKTFKEEMPSFFGDSLDGDINALWSVLSRRRPEDLDNIIDPIDMEDRAAKGE